MSDNIGVIVEKSKRFAVRIVRLCQYLQREKKELVLSKQILRSGTSVGANLAEAKFAISRNEFLSKQYIALKEVAETMYWLELLRTTEYITEKQCQSLYADAAELKRLLSSSTKTIRETRPVRKDEGERI